MAGNGNAVVPSIYESLLGSGVEIVAKCCSYIIFGDLLQIQRGNISQIIHIYS